MARHPSSITLVFSAHHSPFGLVAAALYLVDPSAVLFGIILVMIGYLIFDVFELGSYGSMMFLAFLYLVLTAVISILLRSGTLEPTASRVSLKLIQDALMVAVFVFIVNLVAGARIGISLREKFALLSNGLKRAQRVVLHRMHRFKSGRESDRIVDQWIRLMSESEKISGRDPQTFELVRNHLEKRLSTILRDTLTGKE